MPTPSEFEIQRAFVMWFCGVPGKVQPARRPGVVSWHTPNGGARDAFEARRLKEMGVLAGIPDYFMLWGTLYALEFKKKGGRLSAVQEEVIPILRAAGAVVEVVDNLDDAKKFAFSHSLALTVC